MKRSTLALLALLPITIAGINTAHAQSPFATTDSEARLSQRSTIVGDFNTVGREDTIYQGAYASTPDSGALNAYAQAYLDENYGPGPMFSYDQDFVTQFGFGFGSGNSMTMSYSGTDDTSQDGQGGIDRKVIIAEQIALQNGNGNATRLAGDVTQVGRPLGSGLHGDILDLKLDVVTQVGVQVGNNNDLALDLVTEQSDR